MALTFEVSGPNQITMKTASGAYVEIGRGDNDDLFRVETESSFTDIFTNESGTMPAESIRTGFKVNVYFSLIAVNRTSIETIIQFTDGNSGSTAGMYYPPVVGNLVKPGITGDTTVDIKCAPDTAGGRTVEVFRCRILSVNQQDFGNKPTRMVFKAEAMPDADSMGSAMYKVT